MLIISYYVLSENLLFFFFLGTLFIVEFERQWPLKNFVLMKKNPYFDKYIE